MVKKTVFMLVACLTLSLRAELPKEELAERVTHVEPLRVEPSEDGVTDVWTAERRDKFVSFVGKKIGSKERAREIGEPADASEIKMLACHFVISGSPVQERTPAVDRAFGELKSDYWKNCADEKRCDRARRLAQARHTLMTIDDTDETRRSDAATVAAIFADEPNSAAQSQETTQAQSARVVPVAQESDSSSNNVQS